LMARYYDLLLNRPLPNELHPLDAKKQLASQIVATYHSPAQGGHVLAEWERRFSGRDLEQAELPSFSVPAEEEGLLGIVVAAYRITFGLTKSRGDARRLIEQGSIQLNSEKLRDPQARISLRSGDILRLDKTRALRVR